MSPTRIGIDLSQSPLRIGGHAAGHFIVAKGSTGSVKVNNIVGVKEEAVVESFKDAANVVKSFFGAPTFDSAVVVVPNSTSEELRNDIGRYGQAAGFNISQVIDERLAAAVCYGEKAQPTEKTKLAIVSLSADIVDVSVVSVLPSAGSIGGYVYIDHDHKAHPEPILFEQPETGGGSGLSGRGILGFVEGAAKALVVEPIQKAVDVVVDLFEQIEFRDGHLVDKVVYVGKAAGSGNLQWAVKEQFPGSYKWSEYRDADEIAAYGAAVVSHHDGRVMLCTEADAPLSQAEIDKISVEEEYKTSAKGDELGMFHHGG